MKEEGHFLFQGSSGVDHAVQPHSDVNEGLFSAVIPLYKRHVYRRKPLRRNKVIDDFLVSLLAGQSVKFRGRSSETGAPHQVSH
jgi:hypothetical protein